MKLRIAGEAPAILGGLQVVLAFLLSIDAFHLTANTVALIMAAAAALSACVVAWATQHLVVGLVIGAVNALAALFAGYGFTLSESTTAAVIGGVVFVFSIINRQLTSPVTTAGAPAPGAVAFGPTAAPAHAAVV